MLGYGVVLTVLRLFANGLPDGRSVAYGLAVFLGRARRQGTELKHFRRRLHRRGCVAHVLVLAEHLEGIEAVRRVKRIAGVVAVGPPVIKQNHPRNAAGAVRAEPPRPVAAVTSLLQGRGDGNGIVVCPDDACPLSADFTALGGRWAKLWCSDPRADAHHLRAKPIPLPPHHQKLLGYLRRAVPIGPGPGVRVSRVRVDRGRQHVLNRACAQFKHHLGLARIAVHRPTDLAGGQHLPGRRTKQNLAPIRAPNNPRGRRKDGIKVDVHRLHDHPRVGHVVNVQRNRAAQAVQHPDVVGRAISPMRWAGGLR